MNSQEPKNWKQTVEELKSNIYNTSKHQPEIETQLVSWLTPIQDWFGKLSLPGKVVVVVVGIIAVFSALNILLRLVVSLISVAILGLVFYFLYRFLSKSDSMTE